LLRQQEFVNHISAAAFFAVIHVASVKNGYTRLLGGWTDRPAHPMRRVEVFSLSGEDFRLHAAYTIKAAKCPSYLRQLIESLQSGARFHAVLKQMQEALS
jgi:hypothetical protein